MNEPLTPMAAADTAKNQPIKQRRHGLIEDWRDAVGILLLLFVAAFFGAIMARYWPDIENANTTAAADLEPRLATLEAKVALPASNETAALKTKIATLESRISGLEQTINAFGAVPSSTTGGTGSQAAFPLLETAKRVEDVTTRLTALESKTATTPEDIQTAKTAIDGLSGTTKALTTSVEGLTGRLEKLESSDLLEMARRASIAAAIANLTRATQGSSPFKTEYDVVAALMPGDTKLQQIAPVAASGLPTVGTLISTYADSADKAMDAENLAKGGTWWTKLWANFSSLVSWRSTNEQAGGSTESRLARAGIRLKAGDLPAAVKELEAIKGAAKKPLTAWLAQASARVKLEASLADLNAEAIQAITGTASDEPVPQLPQP